MTSTILEMSADFQSIRELGVWLRVTMDQLGIDSANDSFVGPIELAVHELAANCIDHAKATRILIDATVTGNMLTINLTDDGAVHFEPTSLASAPTEPQVRGYGLMILENVAQSVGYERTDHVNQWRLQFSLQP